ncbi:unnamed protein product [Euphydryas editha]|uniref:Uncharacterized protein n=1 Tax=Euphydryas editha TaxID=104508 RepID=A0AAU9V0I2_EUPED|nr:unnamed protein product [Euphydryas editha]
MPKPIRLGLGTVLQESLRGERPSIALFFMRFLRSSREGADKDDLQPLDEIHEGFQGDTQNWMGRLRS